MRQVVKAKLCEYFFCKVPRAFEHSNPHIQESQNQHCFGNKLIIYCNSITCISFNYISSKHNRHNKTLLDVIPDMTAIRLDDGLATTAHRHVPKACALRNSAPGQIAVIVLH